MNDPDVRSASSWPQAAAAVWRSEWQLLRRYPKLALAMAGLLLVPALYAWIYLYAIWDPAAHTRDLPAGLVNLDAGATYRDRSLNLGQQVLDAIEQQGQFAYRRYDDPAQARRAVRTGQLAFVLEIPVDFSQRALPGEQPGAAKLTLYTSEGNNYASAGFARQFAPEVAQRVNTMISEVRWNLVLASADGSQRSLDTLRAALGDLQRSTGDLQAGLSQAREGSQQLSAGTGSAAEAAARLRAGAAQLADGAQQMAGQIQQASGALRAAASRTGAEADLQPMRQALAAQVEGQRELLRGLEQLGGASRQLGSGLEQLRLTADDIPLFGGRLTEGLAPLADGVQQLGTGIERARDGQQRLLQGSLRLQEGMVSAADAGARTAQAASQSMIALTQRLPDESRTDSLVDGTRDLVRGHDALIGGVRQLGAGTQTLQAGLQRLTDGAGRLDTGIGLVRQSLPSSVERPEGSAQGLALSVEPVLEVVAPVQTQGHALLPNFVPLAQWVGATMVVFLIHLRRVPAALVRYPRSALAAGKLALPLAVVIVQALLMLAMLRFVLAVPVVYPAQFVLALVTTSVAFLGIVWALVRTLGDLGKVAAVLLFIVQLSGAGALLPIELSDEAFQVLHPYLPLSWVVQVMRASLFGAFDGSFWHAYSVVAAVALAALVLGAVFGRWRGVEAAEWRPPLDIE